MNGKPLDGLRLIELAGIGPAPYAGQLLADMGAEIILINRPGPMAAMPHISNRGKRTMTLDLRKADAVAVLLDLVKTADGLFEGLRPGVTERLGVGPEVCHGLNPALVYGRMTGWGQTGPWAKTAGHDINYISITGALAAMGREGEVPTPPLNLVGDFGGGSLFLVMGMLAALLRAQKTGQGNVVDAAMIDGVSSMMGLFYTLAGLGQWQPKRGVNLLDGAMPYYRCYETLDGLYMAVGCIEPQFFALMLSILEIDAQEFGPQNHKAHHAAQHKKLEIVFKSKTREQWAEIFDGTDACVSPVLDYLEAAEHPQNRARGGLVKHGPFVHPRSAPVFGGVLEDDSFAVPGANDAGDDVLSDLGYDAAKMAALKASGALG